MNLRILADEFSVCKIDEKMEIPLQENFVFFSKTDEENSLVCPTRLVPQGVIVCEDGWKGFRIQGELDFSLIGILSKISVILAEQAIGIFVISTYNTDYVFVKESNLSAAIKALSDAGYHFEPDVTQGI